MTRKINIAGKPDAKGRQQCTRCGAKLEGAWKSTYWPVGAAVMSDGRGNMRVVDSETQTRSCGRKGAK